jgi:nitrogenase molybdenum-iron protein alpha/beta subunit
MTLESDRPESLLGTLLGFEGVRDVCTIVHGPTGCKYYPASASENGFRDRGPGYSSRNVFKWGDDYFFGQPRIPCTYLDFDKFVSGAGERLDKVYKMAEALEPSLICIVNTPGASLIGENLTAVGGRIPTVRADKARYSGTFADGFQDAQEMILQELQPQKRETVRGRVNLMGITIFHLNWDDDVAELTKLLNACGIEVGCTAGAGWAVKDIVESVNSELNVLIFPEFGRRTAELYEKKWGVPFFESPEGAPIGFDATEAWIKGICARLGKDPAPAIEMIREGRKKAVRGLQKMESVHMLPRGRTFSVYADGSMLYAVSRFLYDYLGMVPVALKSPSGADWEKKAEDYFASKRIPVSDDPEHTQTDIIVSSGALCVSAVERGYALASAVIEGPGNRFVHVEPEPVLGVRGTLRLVDAILNDIANRQHFM